MGLGAGAPESSSPALRAIRSSSSHSCSRLSRAFPILTAAASSALEKEVVRLPLSSPRQPNFSSSLEWEDRRG